MKSERTAVSSDQKPLLDLTFCIYFVTENLFLSRKSQGTMPVATMGSEMKPVAGDLKAH